MHFPLTNTIAVTITLYLFTDGLNSQINQFQIESQTPEENSAKRRAAGWKKKISILTIRGTFTSHLDGQKVST